MIHRVEIRVRPEFRDAAGEGFLAGVRDLGVKGISKIRQTVVYLFEGDLTQDAFERIAGELLTDPVTQEYFIGIFPDEGEEHSIEVAYNEGVMDPVEGSVKKALKDMGIDSDINVKTHKKYVFAGHPGEKELQFVAEKLLVNRTVQHVVTGEEGFVHTKKSEKLNIIKVPIRDISDDNLLKISKENFLALNLKEMQTIQNYYCDLGRDPTDVELETFGQTWSEHCVHKTFRGVIEYNGEEIDSLFKTYISKVTHELDRDFCVSVFDDNSGVIRFDDEHNVCFKVETHNFPSSLEPYGGAGTGIGGVIRDPLGTGLGAKPIANTDIFCFAPPDTPMDNVPPGALHPRRVFKGVVAGVRDYGNRMGIPTVNGAIFFDERYIGNPIVYCGNVGLIPKDKSFKEVKAGDLVLVVGGRTGRDGIHGATFSSLELTDESETISSGAVQIGNPIEEKKMTDCILKARDEGLYRAITDCGAGGLSSAVGETAEEVGAEVNLEVVPLKYEGLTYTEIWISEAQERMVLAVPPENLDRILEIFRSEDVDATVIGRYGNDGKLTLKYNGEVVGELNCGFLFGGVPQIRRKAEWKEKEFSEPDFTCPEDLGKDLHSILSSYNVCSKEWVIRQYDHEVQGGSVVKPLMGKSNDAPSDASIFTPKPGSTKGLILANGINPKYGLIDPYHMAMSAIDEALRQVVSVGGDIEKTALLDNFSWGNTERPDRLGDLVRATKGCYDAAVKFGTPFISGKDSLHNEFEYEGKVISIPPTLLISAVSVMEDVTKAVTMDIKASGNVLFIVGRTYDEMGGSHYYDIHGFTGNKIPRVDPYLARRTFLALRDAIGDGLVRSCHDLSEGGLGVSLAEMCFGGEIGARIELARVPRGAGITRNDTILFSESNTRFLVEVSPDNTQKFYQYMEGIPRADIGITTGDTSVIIVGIEGETVLDENLYDLKESWQKPLRML